MRFFTVAFLAAMIGAAAAQTHVGGVTLTPVGQVPPRPPASTASASTPASSATVSKADLVPVPPGLRELRGRIMASSEGVRLPAGSQFSVTIRNAQSGREVARIGFTTIRLSAPYQMIFSPARINTSQRYVVRAEISSAGKVIYSSADLPLPRETRAVLNIPVSPR